MRFLEQNNISRYSRCLRIRIGVETINLLKNFFKSGLEGIEIFQLFCESDPGNVSLPAFFNEIHLKQIKLNSHIWAFKPYKNKKQLDFTHTVEF